MPGLFSRKRQEGWEAEQRQPKRGVGLTHASEQREMDAEEHRESVGE